MVSEVEEVPLTRRTSIASSTLSWTGRPGMRRKIRQQGLHRPLQSLQRMVPLQKKTKMEYLSRCMVLAT